MKRSFLRLLLLGSIVLNSCSTLHKASSKATDDGKIDITFVQVNDVYEIAPVDGGKSGGIARVAALKKQYLKSNPNTYLVMSGDFLSPSVYNSLQYQDKRIRGKQMVEALNSAGMDLAVFGNHEFDISESELQDRLNESAFGWVSTNTFHKTGDTISAFYKTSSSGKQTLPETYIRTVSDADGTSARIGFIGLTIPFNKASYVSYTDPLQAAQTAYNRLKDSCDAVVAVTHLLIDDDVKLAQNLPGLAVIMGGHEHDMRFKQVGKVYITKAHANARSAYIVNLTIDKKTHSVNVKPELKMIDQSVDIDSATDVVVKKWMDIADKNYSSVGFDARKVVMASGEPLEARESEIRKKPTNFSKLIVGAMHEAVPEADLVIFNSGSIRVDDILQPPVTQYDIIRSLPFGGGISEVEMKGRLLAKILDAGKANLGIGGFLHYSPALFQDETTKAWSFNGESLNPDKTYRVAITDFLMTGGEAKLDFLKPDNPDVVKVYPHATAISDPRSDIRLAIIRYMEKKM